jgi:hypothetical protein
LEKPFHRFGAAAAVPLFDRSIAAGGGALALPLQQAAGNLAGGGARPCGLPTPSNRSAARAKILKDSEISVDNEGEIAILFATFMKSKLDTGGS